jgi:hypothetical protein
LTEVPPLAAFMPLPPAEVQATPPQAFEVPPPAFVEPLPPTPAEPAPPDLSAFPTPLTAPLRVSPSGPSAPASEPKPAAGGEVFEVELPEPVPVQTGRVMLPTALGTPEQEMAEAGPPLEELPLLVLPKEEVPSFEALAEEMAAPGAHAAEAAALGDPFGDMTTAGGGASGDVFQLEPPSPPAPVPELVFPAEAPPPLELSPEAKGALVQRVVPRALAQVGEVRELELEVPVPAVWTGGKKLTLQLRLTLIPEEDTHAE